MILVYIVGVIEVLAALMLMLGLYTPVAALLLLPDMGAAMWKYNFNEGIYAVREYELPLLGPGMRELERDNLAQVFGTSETSMSIQVAAANYMYYRGNQLRFGKLTMTDTDMLLIDMNPQIHLISIWTTARGNSWPAYTKETPSFG
jgi:DoxX-like protein